MPAAAVDRTTISSAWPVAVRSASISSKTGTLSFAAPIALWRKVIDDCQFSSFCGIGIHKADGGRHDDWPQYQANQPEGTHSAQQADKHQKPVHLRAAGQQHRPQEIVDHADAAGTDDEERDAAPDFTG